MDEVTIYDALRDGARVSTLSRWLVQNLEGDFTVYSKPPYAKKVVTLYRGKDEAQAVKALMGESWEEE